jgi:hypothetical protein
VAAPVAAPELEVFDDLLEARRCITAQNTGVARYDEAVDCAAGQPDAVAGLAGTGLPSTMKSIVPFGT